MTFYMTDHEYRVLKRMLRRNIYRNLEKLDKRLDRMIKGTGDLIGGALAGAGAITLAIGAGVADSVAYEDLNTWGMVMIFALIATAAGVKILNWMRT